MNKKQVIKDMYLNLNSPTPYYFQLKELLLEAIKTGKLKPAQQIPTEQELCQQFNISRTVVRQAINELVSNGYLVTKKGKGTFVAKPKIRENLFQNLSSNYQDMLARGIKLITKVMEQEKCEAPPRISEILKLQKNDFVIKIKRLRFIDNEPFTLTTSFIPYRICPLLLNEDLTNQSLYGLLEDKYRLKLYNGYRSCEAILANKKIAGLLKIQVGSPVMLLHSISYLKDGQPIEYYEDFHRGDRSRCVVSLIRVKNYSEEFINKTSSSLLETGIIINARSENDL